MIDNRKFTALLRKCSRAAAAHTDISNKIGEIFEERYGVTYSDVDCDWLIDELDIVGSYSSSVTAKIADYYMEECGYKVLEKENTEIKEDIKKL